MNYYKRVKIIACIIIFVVLMGSILWLGIRGGAMSWKVSRNILNLSGPYNEVGRYKVNSTEIKNFRVSWVAGSINISPYEQNEITIIEYAQRDLKEEENLKIDTNSNTLKINYCKSNGYMSLPEKKLEVFIPADLANNLDKVMVDKTSGDLKIHDIVANECEIDSSSGDSKLINLKLDKLNVDVASGDTIIDDSIISKLIISSSSGDVNLSKLEGSKLTIDTSSGDVNINNLVSQEISISTASGDVDIIDLDSQEISISTASGDVDINDFVSQETSINTTSGDLTMKKVTTSKAHIDTASGEVLFIGSFHELDAESSSGTYKVTNQIPPKAFNIKTKSGDVIITMPEFEGFDLTFDTSSGDLISDIPMRKVSKSNYKIRTTSGDVTIISLK